MDQPVTVTFAGSGDAFGSGGRFQACVHVRAAGQPPFLIDCGSTSLTALRAAGLDPGEIGTVFVSHLHGDHFGGLPFLILDGQFTGRTSPLTVAGPPGTAARLHQAMETLFPGSAGVTRRFGVEVTELAPGGHATVNGVGVASFEVSHPSGAPPLALRLTVGEQVIAYTGDTAWTDALPAVADGAGLLIAEAYSFSKAIPYHLSFADLAAHRGELACRRVVLTHMSADMLARGDQPGFETARDGCVLRLPG